MDHAGCYSCSCMEEACKNLETWMHAAHRMSLGISMQCWQDSQHSIYVELGAGKGYLTAMLGSMSTLGGALMLDTGSFRHKADRCARYPPASCPTVSTSQHDDAYVVAISQRLARAAMPLQGGMFYIMRSKQSQTCCRGCLTTRFSLHCQQAPAQDQWAAFSEAAGRPA